MANALAANSVTATQLAAGSVTANAVAANAIGANAIAANAVTANKISVSSLSALSANLGNVTAGNITGVNITGSTIISTGNGNMWSDTVYLNDNTKSAGIYMENTAGYDYETSISSGQINVEKNTNPGSQDGDWHETNISGAYIDINGSYDGYETEIEESQILLEKTNPQTTTVTLSNDGYIIASEYTATDSHYYVSQTGGSWQSNKLRGIPDGNDYAGLGEKNDVGIDTWWGFDIKWTPLSRHRF